MWSGTLAEVVQRELGDKSANAALFRPWLQSGFPWHAPQVIRDPLTVDADTWWNALSPVITNALVGGATLDVRVAQQLLPMVRATYCDASRWRLFDDSLDTLQRLASLGWRHVVLSNHVPELRQIMSGLGLTPYFDAVYSSAETGVEKPNPASFERVIAKLPDDLPRVMVGDSYEADVLGARRCGLDAILVRRPYRGESRFAATLGEVETFLS